jgi:two-component system OmpR family response regulator
MYILLAEDDEFLSHGISMALRDGGYRVDHAKTGPDAEAAARSVPYDLLILDLNLPLLDGREVLKRLRKEGQGLPVLVLTAYGSVEDRIHGLDLGANDYMTKPFDLGELEARVRALLRASTWNNRSAVTVGSLQFDTFARRAFIRDEEVELAARELAVLEFLLQNVGRVVTKQQLTDYIAGMDGEISNNALDILICRLRKKIDNSDCAIRTIRGLGYIFESSGK